MKRPTLAANRKAEEEKDPLHSILDSIADPVMILSEDRQILFINRSFKQKFGEVENRPCHEVFHGDRKLCTDGNSSQVSERNETLRSEGRLVLNNPTFEVPESLFPYRGERVSDLTVFQDTIAHKQAGKV